VNPPGSQENASTLRDSEGSLKRGKTVQTGAHLRFIICIPKCAALISINRCSVDPYRSGVHDGSLIHRESAGVNVGTPPGRSIYSEGVIGSQPVS